MQLQKNFKFEKLEEVSKKDDKAEVKVKITSADLSVAVTKAVGELCQWPSLAHLAKTKNNLKKRLKNNDLNYHQKLNG